jgi:hypothetical protein
MTEPNPLHQVPVIDRESAFMLYASFAGDVEKTAHALGVSPVAVLAIVDEDKWLDKLRVIIELKKSGRPGDLERGINRALNFVMAHRYRLFLERVVSRLVRLTDCDLEHELFPSVERLGKDGAVQSIERKMNTRALADLAAALEKCHAMTYAALNDSTSERVKRKDTDGNDSVTDMHAKIAQAMAQVGSSDTLRARLFDAQIAKAQALPSEAVEGARRAAYALLKDTRQPATPPPEDPNEDA